MNENIELSASEQEIARASYVFGWNDAINTMEEAMSIMDKNTEVQDVLGVFKLLIRKEQNEQAS